ncbi:MAG: hypothetical protein V7L21_28135 [Nostoc sp.]|uniref:hypothetical protein n=1 Tax=Nostoc sp. TaxID=1180 RepID=UPI002FF67920
MSEFWIKKREGDTKEESGTIAKILPQLSPPLTVVASSCTASLEFLQLPASTIMH